MERENGIGAVPVHVGIIMDGNRQVGHEEGQASQFPVMPEGVKTMKR